MSALDPHRRHIVLYHANCADGFAAASIYSVKYPDALYLPIGYDDPMPLAVERMQGGSLTLLDFSFPEKTLFELAARVNHLTVIDHHATAGSAISKVGREIGNQKTTIIFDTKWSGCELTWQYVNVGQPIPAPLGTIGWRDRGGPWQPDADKAVSDTAQKLYTGLMRATPRRFEAWLPILLSQAEMGIQETKGYACHDCIYRGEVIMEADYPVIGAAARNPIWIQLGGYRVPAICSLPPAVVSDAIHALLMRYPGVPFAAAFSIDAKSGRVSYSLRSCASGSFNVGTFAASMDPRGGGHPNAAGFSTDQPIQFA